MTSPLRLLLALGVVASISSPLAAARQTAAPAKQPAQPAGPPAATDRPKPAAAEFTPAWRYSIDAKALWRAIGHYSALQLQLSRIQKLLPAHADAARTAAARLSTALDPGFEELKKELRRRAPTSFEKDFLTVEKNTLEQAEKMPLKEDEVRAAFESGRWDAKNLPADVLAPLLTFTPKYAEKPELLIADGFTLETTAAIPNSADLRASISIPRSWINDANSKPPQALWAVKSNMGKGPAIIVLLVTPNQQSAASTTPELILKGIEQQQEPVGLTRVSAEIMSSGGRQFVAKVCDGLVDNGKLAFDQRLLSLIWAEKGYMVNLTLAVGLTRDSQQRPIDKALLVRVLEAHRELLNEMAATLKIEPAPPAETPQTTNPPAAKPPAK